MPETLETRVAHLEQRFADELDSIRRLSRVVEDLAVTKERAAAGARKAVECLAAVEKLEGVFHEREREMARERKSDRRWMIGVGLTCAGLVISAMAILIGHI